MSTKRERSTSAKGSRRSTINSKSGKKGGKGRTSPKSRSPSVKSRDEENPVDPQQLLAQLKQSEKSIQELQKENNEWSDRYHTLENAFNLLSKQYNEIKEIIYENGNVYKYETDSKAIEDLDHSTTLQMLSDICYTAKHPPSTEARLEEMETRITKQNAEVAYLLANSLLYESVLSDIYHTRDVDYIHDKVADTFIQTEKYYSEMSGKTEKDTPLLPTITVSEVPHPQVQPPPALPSTFQRLQQRMQDIRLVPPIKRMAGITHVDQMNMDLKMYLCRDLNLERRSGCDWRMLAARIGIPTETIEQWRRLKLASPMNRLLAVWGQSENATMRMLHRHLSSPEMNAVLLAKRVEDFYDV